jgi:hypothetical protein
VNREQLEHVLRAAAAIARIDAATLRERIRALDAARYPADAIAAWAERRILETTPPP